jgi:hypothetical protein
MAIVPSVRTKRAVSWAMPLNVAGVSEVRLTPALSNAIT